jgi:IrrE N-terminal-like domain
MKKDDSSLPLESLIAVKKQALKALEDSGALGVFPTPIDQVLYAAKVVLAPEADFSEGLLQRFRKRFGGVTDLVKKAMSKVIGLFDVAAMIIYIDKTLHVAKKNFLKLHETGHSFLPWQVKAYALIEDCQQTLDPDIADQFDREANIFAKEVLFQGDSFSKEAADYNLSITTPLKLSKKYGASIYSSVREYVRSHHHSCTVLVLEMPELSEGKGFVSRLRRFESSSGFIKIFGHPQWPLLYSPDDPIGAIVPVGRQRCSKPRIITLIDLNGVEHECVAEAFTQTYQVFVLITPVSALTSKSVIISPL